METKAQKKAVEAQAKSILKRLAVHQRIGKHVVAIQGLDAEIVCICNDEVDAEVIARALNHCRGKLF